MRIRTSPLIAILRFCEANSVVWTRAVLISFARVYQRTNLSQSSGRHQLHGAQLEKRTLVTTVLSRVFTCISISTPDLKDHRNRQAGGE